MDRKGGVGSGEASSRLLELARRQHGVVATRQLEHVGVSWAQLRVRATQGWLRRIHQGVYALAGRERLAPTRWMAAVLASGPGAYLSHRDAAALWGIAPRLLGAAALPGAGIEVTVAPEKVRRNRDGISLHRCALDAGDLATRSRIPVTAPQRTVRDLATLLSRRKLERVIDEAERLGLCTGDELAASLGRNRGRPGAARVAAVLDAHAAGSTLTRSELEERFLALCREAGLPGPLVNAPLLGLTVDFFWPPALVVEVDGAESHLTRRAFEDDRDRDSLLGSNGYRVVRFTWRDVTIRPRVVAHRVGRMLADVRPQGRAGSH